MHRNRSVGITLVVILCAASPLMTAWPPLSFSPTIPIKTYPGNHAFIHETGIHNPYGWEAFYREHRPGYFIKGLQNGGDPLAEGVYRYDFYFALRPGHLASLLSGANDLVRVEVADQTTRETLLSKTFQMADIQIRSKRLIPKSLVFSTWSRGGHRFEPRIYWPGLSGLFLQRIELVELPINPPSILQKKSDDFEAMMPRLFLENGYVVTRDENGNPSDLGDAAMWTGLYVAAETWRFRATQDKDALKRFEQSLWALHALVQESPLPGTMVRYVGVDQHILGTPPSKDTYTGYFYAVAEALPFVRDPALKKALQSDVEALGQHFLDHDFSFLSSHGHAVDLNPYLDQPFLKSAIQDLHENTRLRKNVIHAIQMARWYFWLHGQSAPPSFSRLAKALRNPATCEFERELLPFANDLRTALQKLEVNIHHSALRGTREGLTDTPYIKMDLLLLKTLKNLNRETNGHALASLDDLKILPSEALNALHILKVAAETLPKPNRFEKAYEDNLYDGKALLETAIQWHQIDEDLISAIFGETAADTRRTASAQVSYLALHDLILLEKDPAIRFTYQKLFEDQFRPMRSDGNAMIDAMQASVGLSESQTGLIWWTLSHYPIDRVGKGDRYWKENRKELLDHFGGEVNGQARDPIPPDLRPRDAFLWQRSARSIRGDQEGWLYPPLDYLFAYWLARITPDERRRYTDL